MVMPGEDSGRISPRTYVYKSLLLSPRAWCHDLDIFIVERNFFDGNHYAGNTFLRIINEIPFSTGSSGCHNAVDIQINEVIDKEDDR